ncbi:MAG TPA: hypothetical protein VJA82_02210 [Sediminibacterium sp.]|uniref:hypothetical protein n=1 Tax=Sediminibacterium sp. TaxID=1917865 RepID=UPI0008B2C4BE|nr:hypothetical protein [Sediminibacterium sp.]OHC84114.1 MAG: hypothetical protein A2472_13555 [Sphingobacteriia bacterium RIFOXYC2_FULL_35_18]OHC87839.1 MAG: hypothetical protein A2546_05615 [Sphingobacteriia bacterium RIFOXYD2_FULL_35_12]HLD52094.1 hypothetical protein [Sediminibacterium sp.]
MTNEEIKNQFLILKDNMYGNYAIYHERSTFLIQLTKFEILDLGVRFRAKLIKPLDKKQAEKTTLNNHYLSNTEFTFASAYLFPGQENSSILMGNKLMRAYCPYILWLDPELVKFVIENDEEVTEKVAEYIVFNKDWTVLKR